MTIRRSRDAILALITVAALAACTSGDDDPESGDDSTTTASATKLTRPSAPLQVTIAEASGIAKGERTTTRKRLTRPIAAWIDGAFLDGDYPRSDFQAGFASWTPKAARLAKRDQAFTTNATLGPDLVGAVADVQKARAYVFGRGDRTGGATADVLLRLTGEKTDGSLVMFSVKGNLYLTRNGAHWRIFGYDLARTEER